MAQEFVTELDATFISRVMKSWDVFEKDGKQVDAGSSMTVHVVVADDQDPLSFKVPAKESSWRRGCLALNFGDPVRFKVSLLPVIDGNGKATMRLQLLAIAGDTGNSAFTPNAAAGEVAPSVARHGKAA
jgi:hypothetical protein